MSSTSQHHPRADPTLQPDEVTIVDGAESTPAGAAPAVGALIGRYVVVGPLGEGGMGHVMRAYDTKLHREVALKLLRSSGNEEARARIVREAQAMAQLTHPNVVSVYDVDTDAGRPFIAMEYVEGGTLRAWLDDERPWRETIECFRLAGRGLDAAHRAGLVHRDFKPANVLVVEREGKLHRVLVTDFGLARGVEHLSSNAPAAILDSVGDTLTIAGTVMGTPVYMAPEQHKGGQVDARSDQYAFCVALWEALAGERPFAGPNLAKAKAHPERLTFPAKRAVPGYVRRVLLRGLSVDPTRRYASMEDLLRDLSGAAARKKRLLRAGAAAALVVAGLGAHRLHRARAMAECATVGESISAVYDADVGDAIATQFHATGSPLAEQTLSRILPRLDTYASEWTQLRTNACIASEVEGQDRATYRLASECFEERRTEFEQAVEALLDAEAATLAFAVSSIAALSPVQDCADSKWLHTRLLLPEDDGARDAVSSVRKGLAGLRALVRAGRYGEAEAKMPELTGKAEALGFAPLLARTRMLESDLAANRGDRDEAVERLESAFYTAVRAGADDLAADAAISLTFHTVYDEAGDHKPRMWADLAQVLLERTGQTDGTSAAALENNRAVLLERMKKYDEALAGHARTITLRHAIFDGEDPGVASSYNNIGNIHYDRKDLDAARESYETSIEIRERLLGTAHPNSTLPLQNVGDLEYDARAYEDALMYFEDARDIYVRVWGEDHMFVSKILGRIGRIYYARGQFELALAQHERALEIALAHPGDPRITGVLTDVGQTYDRLGLHEEALPLYERALRLLHEREPLPQTTIAFTQTLVGSNLLARGQPGAALPLLEDALSRAEAADVLPGTLASTEFVLARALWLDPDQRRRALEVAAAAIAHYEAGGPWNDIWKAEVQAWLDERTTSPTGRAAAR
jgi:eukaryotic-like serine/threonine-protein kinase